MMPLTRTDTILTTLSLDMATIITKGILNLPQRRSNWEPIISGGAGTGYCAMPG